MMATRRQKRLHAINSRLLKQAVRTIRSGSKRVLERGSTLIFAAAIQYLMPKDEAEAEQILKASKVNAGDVFKPKGLKAAGIDPASDATKLTMAQIQEAGLVFAADTFDEFFTTAFGKDFDALMLESATTTGNAWIGNLNPDALENFHDVMSKKWLREHGLDLATSMSNSLKPQLQEALAQAIVDQNTSVANMVKELRKTLTDFETWRLERIARTEGNAASSNGALESYKQSGVVKSKEWYNPDPQHEYCIAESGRVVPLDETFSGGLEGPPAHPNCQSSVLPVLA